MDRDEDKADEVIAASLLHEIRQPLFAIKALAQVSRADAAPGLFRRRMDQLLEQVAHLEAVVDQHGAARDPAALFDLNEPVRAAIQLLDHRRREVDAHLVQRLAGEPLTVRGRPVAARQVALNLLHNAFDAVEGLGRRRVVICTRREGDRVVLEIEDSGAGLPAVVRDRVFDPFVTTKGPGRGSGLGLYIARSLVREAEGALELAAARHGGTRAAVSLPLAA